MVNAEEQGEVDSLTKALSRLVDLLQPWPRDDNVHERISSAKDAIELIEQEAKSLI
jgi:hypothetical protein